MSPDAIRPVIEPIELQALCRLPALGRLIAVELCWLSLLRAQGWSLRVTSVETGGGLYRPGGRSLDEGGCEFTGALVANSL